MEKNKLARFLDSLLSKVAIWLLAAVWSSYYLDKWYLVVVAATAVMLCVSALIKHFSSKKYRTRAEQKHVDEVMAQFIYGGDDFALDFFQKAIGAKYQTVREGNRLLVKGTAVFVRFTLDKLPPAELARMYAARGEAKRLLILTAEGADGKTAALAAALPQKITVLDRDKTYALMKSLGQEPEIKIVLKKQKGSFRRILSGVISPARAKGYLIASIVLVVSSYFMPFSIYYLVIASVSAVLALLSRLDIVRRIKEKKLREPPRAGGDE